MRWGWIAAGRQAASADGTGVVSARLPERLVGRSRSRADWTGLDGIGAQLTRRWLRWEVASRIIRIVPRPKPCTPMARRQVRVSEISEVTPCLRLRELAQDNTSSRTCPAYTRVLAPRGTDREPDLVVQARSARSGFHTRPYFTAQAKTAQPCASRASQGRPAAAVAATRAPGMPSRLLSAPARCRLRCARSTGTCCATGAGRRRCSGRGCRTLCPSRYSGRPRT